MRNNKPTNILILDDHQIVIDGIKSIMQGQRSYNILTPPSADHTLLYYIQNADIKIVLIDPQQTAYDSQLICKSLKRKHPDLKILGLNIHGHAAHVAKIIRLGLDGYLVKSAGRDALITALDHLRKGGKYFSPSLRKNIMMDLNGHSSTTIEKLSKRESQILQFIVDEYTTEEIADTLFISRTTVITHRKNLLRKLQAKNAAGLVKAAYEYRLLT